MGFWDAGVGAAGIFTLLLGLVHFFLPVLLDFRNAVPTEGTPLKPLRLGFLRYSTLRRDVHGIAWVMNHAASYVLVVPPGRHPALFGQAGGGLDPARGLRDPGGVPSGTRPSVTIRRG